MKRRASADNIALIALIIAVAAIGAVAAIALFASERLVVTNEQVLATQRAVSSLEAIRFQSFAINLGQQNFAITGDERDLARYRSGVMEMEAELLYLERARHANPSIDASFDQLKQAVTEHLAQERALVETRRQYGFAAAQAQIRARADETETDRLHNLSYRILTDVRKRLDLLERTQVAFGDNVRRWIIALISAAALILIFLFGTLRKLNREQRTLQATMEHQATHDVLTGLYNRAAVEQHLERRIGDVATAALGGFALMLIDLDGFKAVNDTLGHAAGDALLKQAGQRMTLLLRETDYLARLGGDEFLVEIPQVSDRETVETIARKIIDTVGVTYAIDGAAANVTASIGISCYPKDGTDRETLMKRADMALYEAKRGGRNHVRFYAPENNNAA
jgi:diguanylate cyclase (GGDEF)-like protein